MGIVILVFCVSCGQSVKETVKPVVPGKSSGQFKRAVILPFADHTPASSLKDHCRRNTLVIEAIQDALYQAGVISAAEEDVVKYLMDRGVIQASNGASDSYRTASLERELGEAWSDEMKSEIQEVIYQEVASSRSGGSESQKQIALTSKNLKDLGSTFGADYIVRGRIIEYRTDQIDSFNPVRTGMIPFVFKSGQRTLFGVAESELYENVDRDATEDYERLRNLFWGGGRLLTGLIGEKQGQVPGATVQIRMLVQDAGTGDVLWLNRAEACSLPRSSFSDPDAVLLFAKSIHQAAESLVNDFVSAVNSGRIPKTKKKAATLEAGKESDIEAFAADVAAERAERSAAEARDSAQRAEDAAAEAKAAAQGAGEAKVFADQAEDAAAEAQKASGEAKEAVKKASEATSKSEKIFKKIIEK